MCSYMFWIQQIEVLAGGKKFQSYGDNTLDIEFDIPFTDKEEPDVSTVTIYNLSEGSISDIEKEGYIFVNAGYRDMNNMANILTGNIEKVETEWQGVDKQTTITVSDGAKAWRVAKLNKTYKEGTKASVIMRDLANILKYEIIEIKPKKDIEYKLGKTIKGACSTSLRQLVKDTESKMFINKNRLVIRDRNIGYQTGFVLSPESGLVGSPTLNKDDSDDKVESTDKEKKKKKNKEEKKSWNVDSLLNPRLETDSIIQIKSEKLSGNFRVVSGRHTRDFLTSLVVEEV